MFKIFRKKENVNKIEKATIENDKIISFGDINLEVYIRKLIKKESGDIYLSDVYNIKKLDFLGWPLIDIRGIQYMTNLVSLNLYYSRMGNISFLSYLENLKKLNLSWGDSLSEIKSIKNLKKLEELIISYSPRISNFSEIRFIISLKVLDLSENRLNNLDFIKELINLEKCCFSKNNLEIIDLSYNKKLKDIDISANNIKNINSLEKLIEIEYLDLSVNKIENIRVLKNLKNLKTIDLRGNNINYKDLSNKTSLDFLKSINCKIKR